MKKLKEEIKSAAKEKPQLIQVSDFLNTLGQPDVFKSSASNILNLATDNQLDSEQQYLKEQLTLLDADIQLQEAEIARLEMIAGRTTKILKQDTTGDLIKSSESARNAVNKQIEAQLSKTQKEI